MTKNVPLEDLEIYQFALAVGECVWNLVEKWEFFSKRAVGGPWATKAFNRKLISEKEGV